MDMMMMIPLTGYRPPPHRGNFVPYDFLKLQYVGRKMTHDSPLEVATFTCNIHVTNVILRIIKIHC